MRRRVRRPARLGPLGAVRTGLTLVAAPVLLAKKLRKVVRNPLAHANELDPARWYGRVRAAGAGPLPRADEGRPHVVLVGKGFGELRLLERLDRALRARCPEVRTTWCGQIGEFFEGAATLRPAQPVVPLPFDVAPAVTGWLARVRPDLVVLVEQFWRPVLASACAAAGVRVVAVNALSWRSLRGPAAKRRVEGWMRREGARAFSAFCFQSEEQARQAASFLPVQAHVAVTGNLKMDLEPAPPDPRRDERIAGWLGSRRGVPLLAAGSTRRGDEAFVLEAFATVRRHRPCSLLLAPRQMERIDEIEGLVAGAGLSTSRRSAPRPVADVYLLDTVGELAAAYPHAEAAFLGGTLRHRGQNFVEPLLHGLPVSFGPSHVYLAEEQRACAAQGLGCRVENPAELAAHWRGVLEAGPGREEVRRRARAFLAGHGGAVERTVGVLIRELSARGGAR